MATVERSIELNVPVSTAYNQWRQFEEFPNFMEGVESVTHIDDKRLHWVVKLGGRHREWDSEITEQKPDDRIAWKAVGDPGNAGVITFHRISDNESRIMVQLEIYEDNLLDKAADTVGSIDRGVKGDLKRFKEFVETRRQETGAWRGEIDREEIRRAG
jgi:uncharacterized membrane protein